MERRSEPRFEIAALGWVAQLDSLNQPRECHVLDISDNGIRLRTNHSLPVDEVICLGFHGHVLMIRIRNVRPLGDTFAVGAERVCSFSKEQFGGSQPTFERLQELLTEQGWNIEVSTAAPVLPPPAPPPLRSLQFPVMFAAALVVMISAGILFLGFRTRHPPPRVISELVSTVPAPPPIVISQPEPPAPAVHHVKISVQEPAWLTASADGKPLLDRGKMFAHNDSFEFDFSKLSYVHLGNSRGVQVVMDGNPVVLPEPHMIVGVLELKPSGSRLLPWSNDDPVAAP
jgi:hypothetical protein